VTYSATIRQILTNYACMNCHGTPTSNGAPYSFTDYAGVKVVVDNQRLLGSINHLNGYAPMPQNLPMMSQCDINKVEAWVAAGAPDN